MDAIPCIDCMCAAAIRWLHVSPPWNWQPRPELSMQAIVGEVLAST